METNLDVIPQLYRRREADGFRQKLQSSTSHIRELVSRHLQLAESDFVLDEPSAWIEGGFNICIGIEICKGRNPRLPQTAVIRFPLPFNIGEGFAPGAMDEKLRCEAATYVWLRENCPNIPLPRLLGMGFPGSQTVRVYSASAVPRIPLIWLHQSTAIENETFFNRVCWYLRRTWNWLHGEKTSPYSVHTRTRLTDVGYLLLEWVTNGKMLSSSWQRNRHDKRRTTNLYRGIAKTMLDLANVPLPRIGLWTMDDRAVLTLANRPFFDLTLLWNRHRIPTGISRVRLLQTLRPFSVLYSFLS